MESRFQDDGITVGAGEEWNAPLTGRSLTVLSCTGADSTWQIGLDHNPLSDGVVPLELGPYPEPFRWVRVRNNGASAITLRIAISSDGKAIARRVGGTIKVAPATSTDDDEYGHTAVAAGGTTTFALVAGQIGWLVSLPDDAAGKVHVGPAAGAAAGAFIHPGQLVPWGAAEALKVHNPQASAVTVAMIPVIQT